MWHNSAVDTPSTNSPRPLRSVVSYVRRSPRMTPSQRSWLDQYGAQWVIAVTHGDLATSVAPQPPLDIPEIFGRDARLVVEIGCGHGETLAQAAQFQPDVDFLGFEVFEASIAATVGKLATAGLANVRLVCADAVSGLETLIKDQAIAEIWVFFPDPWQKLKHHKRRLISPAFADLAARKLSPGGVLRLATDWDSYAETMTRVLGGDPRFMLEDRKRFETRPLTKFESRALEAGRDVRDFAYRRVA